MTGPEPSKSLPGTNTTPRQEAACQGWGPPYCPPRIRLQVRACIVAGAAPATDLRNGDEFPPHAAFCFGRPSAE